MAATCRRIGKLVTRIQEAYLEQPDLALTLEEAETRFRVDAVTCRALFDLFLEAGVLARTKRTYRLKQRGRGGPGLPAAA